MATRVVMPRLGNTVESCLLVEWKVKPGDKVDSETALCDIETDKAAMEIPAGSSGTVLALLREAGEDVPVLAPICVIGEEGEPIDSAAEAASQPSALVGSSASAERGTAPVPSPTDSPKKQVLHPARGNGAGVIRGRPPSSPRARVFADRKAVDLSSLSGSGPGGRIIEGDVKAILSAGQPLTRAAEALARNGARAPARGSGIGGRVVAADMIAPSESAVSEDFTGRYSEEPIRGVRKLISERMLQSLSGAAQLTMHGSADASGILSLRETFKTADPSLGLGGITINDLILLAVSRVLIAHPSLNSHKSEGNLRRFAHVHLGMAVDTPRGLMVPVIRFADTLTISEISAESRRLADACRNGKILPDDLAGSTFTVTNLGSFGVECFTPVLNLPEVAILGVCAIGENVTFVGKELKSLPRIGLSLTIDHCVVDGAPAAAFLKDLASAIAGIEGLIASQGDSSGV